MCFVEELLAINHFGP
uniref:Uncharacterized protein n=1 Tax=Moniliophthora roreri TaxID=221103 RepID=A0A0W0FN07_MONRR